MDTPSTGAPDRATAVTRVVRDGTRLEVVLADLAAPVDEALAVAVVRLVADEALLVELQAAPTAPTAHDDRWRVLQACADQLRREGVRRIVATVPSDPVAVAPLARWGFELEAEDGLAATLALEL